MRNRVRAQGIEAPRGAYDGEAKLGAEVLVVPPPRVFWEKRLQTIENRGSERGKERKETTKRLQVSENVGFATEALSH